MPFLAFFLSLERLFFLSSILYHFRGDTQMINICRTPIQEMHLTRTLPAWFKRFFFAIALLAEARGQKRCRKKKCCGAERSIFTVSGKWSAKIGRVSAVRPSVVEEKQSNQRVEPKSRTHPPNPTAPASGWVGRAHWEAAIGQARRPLGGSADLWRP